MEFKQPSQLAVCQDRLIQDVIGGEDLCRSLSLSYLHPALQSRLSSSLLTALGVHRLRAAEIITVTCSMARELVQQGLLKSGVKSRLAINIFCDDCGQKPLCHVVVNVIFWSQGFIMLKRFLISQLSSCVFSAQSMS